MIIWAVGQLFRLVAAILLAFFVLPWCGIFLAKCWQQMPMPIPDHWALALGLVLGLAFYRWPGPLMRTGLHEAKHAMVALMLRVPVRSVAFTDGDGGQVAYRRCDPFRDTAITIAPYTLPLVPLPFALLRLIFDEPHWSRRLIGAFLVAAMVWHILNVIREARNNCRGAGSDIIRVGWPLSLVLIVMAMVMSLAGLVAVLARVA